MVTKLMTGGLCGALRPQSAIRTGPPSVRPVSRTRSGFGLRDARVKPGSASPAAGRARPSGSANTGSHKLSQAWNFGLASLYNAAMLRLPALALDCLAAARRVCVAGTAGTGRTSRAPSMPSRGLALAVLFSSMAPSLSAHAQVPNSPGTDAKSGAATSTTAKPAKAKAVKSKSGNKVISLDDDFLVEGKLEKPSAFYVLRRSSTDYDWARLDAVFTPLVLESVQDPLF